MWYEFFIVQYKYCLYIHTIDNRGGCMPGRVSDMMYHESAISDACGSVTTIRPSVQEPGTSASEASTPIRLSEQEPVTPSRLSECDNESPRTSRQTESRTTTARSSRRFNRPSPCISVSGYILHY